MSKTRGVIVVAIISAMIGLLLDCTFGAATSTNIVPQEYSALLLLLGAALVTLSLPL